MLWTPAYVGLGSNLADPLEQVRRAVARLGALPRTRLVAVSSYYASRPLGPQDQPDFVNAAAALLTQLSPAALLAALKDLERELGREPAALRWGPRLIDLDLLMHGSTVSAADPVLPHPGIGERNFVLYPLAELAPALRVSGLGRVATLAARLGDEGLRRILMDSGADRAQQTRAGA